jgi:hypothetical protein
MKKSKETTLSEKLNKNCSIMLDTVRCMRTGPEGSRRFRLSDFQTARVGGKVFSPTHRPHLPLVLIPVGG